MKTSKAGRRGPHIVVRRSGIRGRGVFARRPLREGETVCECKGERVSEPEGLSGDKFALAPRATHQRKGLE